MELTLNSSELSFQIFMPIGNKIRLTHKMPLSFAACCTFFSLTLCKTKQGALGSQELSNDVDSLLPPNNEDPGRKLPSE